jgi:hypothetical protein
MRTSVPTYKILEVVRWDVGGPAHGDGIGAIPEGKRHDRHEPLVLDALAIVFEHLEEFVIIHVKERARDAGKEGGDVAR